MRKGVLSAIFLSVFFVVPLHAQQLAGPDNGVKSVQLRQMPDVPHVSPINLRIVKNTEDGDELALEVSIESGVEDEPVELRLKRGKSGKLVLTGIKGKKSDYSLKRKKKGSRDPKSSSKNY